MASSSFRRQSPLVPLFDKERKRGALAVPPGSETESQSFTVACSDEVTPIAATGIVVTFRMAFAMTVTEMRASLTTGTTGSFTVDVLESGASIFSTLLTFDASATTTVGAAVPPVISDPSLADDAEMEIEITNIGGGAATGLKVTFIGIQTV